jgi:hypothetical protein
MGKGLSFFLILMLMRFLVMGQTQPTLQIAESNGVAALSWSGGPAPFYSLQATTNLLPPITWTNLGVSQGNVTMADSQQFFRLAPILPIFQFAIFYNLNMEIDPGAAMTVTGPVFSNGGIWAGSAMTFNLSVAAVGSIYTNTSTSNTADPFDTNYTSSGLVDFAGGAPVSGANELNSPSLGANSNPIAFEGLLNLPPAGLGAPNPNAYTQGLTYLYNDVDIIISNSSSGTLSAFFQNSNTLSAIPYNAGLMTFTTNGVTITTNFNQYSFVTNVNFYDYREGKTVNAVQINVDAFNAWLTNTTIGINDNQANNSVQGHSIDSVYVYNNVPLSSTNLPAVRLSNGSVLPSAGLTIVTPDPIYVLGNYNANGTSLNNGTNVANTVPAALIGDAITVLSTNWNDALYTNSYPESSRNPTNTTINAAVLGGIVQSNGTNYSGGAENFLRLLENWSGDTLTFNGSIVVMFPSQFATNRWQHTGVYYYAPARLWSFDSDFENLADLPPLTPLVVNLVTP